MAQGIEQVPFEFDHYSRHPWAPGARFADAMDAGRAWEAVADLADLAQEAAMRHYDLFEEQARHAAERTMC